MRNTTQTCDEPQREKISFGPDFDVDGVTFKVDGPTSLMSEQLVGKIREALSGVGFCILSCDPRDVPRDDLVALAPLFGRVVPHRRADHYGILGVNARNPVAGFIDSSHQEHRLHTDGAFSDDPEKLITLQCVEPSKSGGASILSSGKAAHDSLSEADRAILYTADALTIERNSDKSTKPVFRITDGGRVQFTFRNDNTAKTIVSKPAQEAFGRLTDRLMENQLRFNLRAFQILIIDNATNAHGRDAFSEGSGRSYHRLNFKGDGLIGVNCGF